MIREMTREDINMLVAMGGQMHAESYFKETEYSPEKCRELGEQLVDNPYLYGIVSEKDGEITGFFLGFIQEHYFSLGLMSSDLLLYVKPEYRSGMAGVRLIKAYIEWARSAGVEPKNIQLGQTAGIDPEVVDKLYKKLGFDSCGTIYKLRG